jgi:hypothetical protein
MPGMKELYSHNPIYDKFFVVSGSVSAVSFPSGTAKMFRMKADSGNQLPFLIGTYMEGVGVYPLYASNELEWTPTPASFQMSEMVHQNASGSTERLYIWMKD